MERLERLVVGPRITVCAAGASHMANGDLARAPLPSASVIVAPDSTARRVHRNSAGLVPLPLLDRRRYA